MLGILKFLKRATSAINIKEFSGIKIINDNRGLIYSLKRQRSRDPEITAMIKLIIEELNQSGLPYIFEWRRRSTVTGEFADACSRLTENILFAKNLQSKINKIFKTSNLQPVNNHAISIYSSFSDMNFAQEVPSLIWIKPTVSKDEYSKLINFLTDYKPSGILVIPNFPSLGLVNRINSIYKNTKILKYTSTSMKHIIFPFKVKLGVPLLCLALM